MIATLLLSFGVVADPPPLAAADPPPLIADPPGRPDRSYAAAFAAVARGEAVTLAVGVPAPADAYHADAVPGFDPGLYRCYRKDGTCVMERAAPAVAAGRPFSTPGTVARPAASATTPRTSSSAPARTGLTNTGAPLTAAHGFIENSSGCVNGNCQSQQRIQR